jgi:hypothetical protein
LKILRKLVLIGAVISLVMISSIAWAGVNQTIDPIPDSKTLGQLHDLHGNVRVVEQYINKGNWLVVMLWASDCEVSQKRISSYNDFNNTSDIKNLEFLGVSLDGFENKPQAIQFIKNHEIDFPNLIGNRTTIKSMFQLLTGNFEFATPSFLVFSPTGELLAQQVGALPPENIEKFINSQIAAQP